jgi:hypothetical protein
LALEGRAIKTGPEVSAYADVLRNGRSHTGAALAAASTRDGTLAGFSDKTALEVPAVS